MGPPLIGRFVEAKRSVSVRVPLALLKPSVSPRRGAYPGVLASVPGRFVEAKRSLFLKPSVSPRRDAHLGVLARVPGRFVETKCSLFVKPSASPRRDAHLEVSKGVVLRIFFKSA